MVLFTKEVFIQLKQLINLHINVNVNDYNDNTGKPVRGEQWQVYIQGVVANVPQHGEMFSTYITCPTKEDAYRLYNDLSRQVIDSGAVPELNTQLIDDVLKEK